MNYLRRIERMNEDIWLYNQRDKMFIAQLLRECLRRRRRSCRIVDIYCAYCRSRRLLVDIIYCTDISLAGLMKTRVKNPQRNVPKNKEQTNKHEPGHPKGKKVKKKNYLSDFAALASLCCKASLCRCKLFNRRRYHHSELRHPSRHASRKGREPDNGRVSNGSGLGIRRVEAATISNLLCASPYKVDNDGDAASSWAQTSEDDDDFLKAVLAFSANGPNDDPVITTNIVIVVVSTIVVVIAKT
jgi:hypothetical protein